MQDVARGVNDYLYVDDDAGLAGLRERWQAASVVGVDTEFIRTRTFYPIAALYQVVDDEGVMLIDPLSIDDWRPLVALLTDADTVKVMHACMEDREVFSRHLETTPVNIFDTQVAAAFLEPTFSPGYAQLVSRYLGVNLDKHATRSDWLARPLNPEQLRYALEDVDYLLPLYRQLTSGLEAEGRLAWYTEEQQRQVFAPPSPADYFTTMRQARRLSPRQLARLKLLTEWREKRARRRDLPRGRVIKDEHLLKMASARGAQRDVVFNVLPEPVARRFWRDLVDLLERADGLDEEALPSRLDPPLSQREGECVKKLRAIGQAQADSLGMAEELLARRRDLEACVRSFAKTGDLPEIYAGWRRAEIGAQFEATLDQYCQAAD